MQSQLVGKCSQAGPIGVMCVGRVFEPGIAQVGQSRMLLAIRSEIQRKSEHFEDLLECLPSRIFMAVLYPGDRRVGNSREVCQVTRR